MQRLLIRSDEYYSPIFARLFYAQYSYLEKKGYAITLEANTPELIEAGDVADEFKTSMTMYRLTENFIYLSFASYSRPFVRTLSRERNEIVKPLALSVTADSVGTCLRHVSEHPDKTALSSHCYMPKARPYCAADYGSLDSIMRTCET